MIYVIIKKVDIDILKKYIVYSVKKLRKKKVVWNVKKCLLNVSLKVSFFYYYIFI